jgi:hypothetical protein
VCLSEGVITTLAGSGVAAWSDGTGTAARFNQPMGVFANTLGVIYIGDSLTNRIRRVTSSGLCILLAIRGVMCEG